MGTRETEQGSATTELEELIEGLNEMASVATIETIHSVLDIEESVSRIAKDSEFLCSGNWERQLACKCMYRETSRVVLFVLLGANRVI